MRCRIGLTLLLPLITVLPANAQDIWLGAAFGTDIQRFAEDAAPNRLDGAATGWTILGGFAVARHVVISVEWSDAGEIEDIKTTSLNLSGREVAITSSFRHRTRGVDVLAGYGHTIARVRLAYLFGAAFTNVRREFTTDAAAVVLRTPSTPAPNSVSVIDRFVTAAGGLQALITVTSHVSILSGARFQRLALDPDVSGWSARVFTGAAWVF